VNHERLLYWLVTFAVALSIVDAIMLLLHIEGIFK
jgi:hypothetical protein